MTAVAPPFPATLFAPQSDSLYTRWVILSGGQSGVDRAALDTALALGIPAGGWCPAGRWAEDGPIPPHYPLRETASRDPSDRTRRNVDGADALLVLAPQPVRGGTALAVRHAREGARPVLEVDPFGDDAAGAIRDGLGRLPATVRILNVAGPRESEVPGVYAAVCRALMDALR